MYRSKTCQCRKRCDQARWFYVVHLSVSTPERVEDRHISGREAHQIARTLDAGTSRLNLATWPNNPNRRARAMLMILSKPEVMFHLIEREFGAITSHAYEMVGQRCLLTSSRSFMTSAARAIAWRKTGRPVTALGSC